MGHVTQRWLVCGVDGQSVGIAADCVEGVTRLGTVAAIPNAPPHVRGMMLLRGRGLPILDLRLLLGMEGRQAERQRLVVAITARRADHVAWLKQLESSLLEDKPFTLATDPRRCAFGRWYDTFKADDAVLGVALMAFEQPHKRIHHLAIEALDLVAHGRRGDALALVQKASTGDLRLLLGLFDRVLPMLEVPTAETVVVVSMGARRFGVCVDEAVELWASTEEPQGQGGLSSSAGLVGGILHQGKRTIVALDCQRLAQAGRGDHVTTRGREAGVSLSGG